MAHPAAGRDGVGGGGARAGADGLVASAVQPAQPWRPPAPGDDEELWSTRIAATVHEGLRGGAAEPLAEVRRVLEGLLGRPLPAGWDDVTAARRGTGREPLTAGDRAELGSAADAFPLLG